MGVNRAHIFLPSTEFQVEPEGVRSAQTQMQTQTFPHSGQISAGEAQRTQSAAPVYAISQDEVKLQWDTSARIAVYQFVNREGSLIVQVPSEQMLSIACQISQALAQEAAFRKSAVIEGGKDSAH